MRYYLHPRQVARWLGAGVIRAEDEGRTWVRVVMIPITGGVGGGSEI